MKDYSNAGAFDASQVQAAYCPTCDLKTDLQGVPCAACVTLEVITKMLWRVCPVCGSWSLARPDRWCNHPECKGAPLKAWRQ